MSALRFAPSCALLLIALTGCEDRGAAAYVADLSHPSRKVRQEASYELVLRGAPAVEPLMAQATGGTDSLQFISAQILGRIGDPRAIPFLRRLARQPNTFVRREALLALGKMGPASPAGFLRAALATDLAPEGRGAAAQSLGNLRDPAAVTPLIQALEDSAALVRQHVVAALHRLWTRPAAAAVLGALQDQDETVRYIAAQALGKHRSLPAREALCSALRDTSVWVRAEAARALGLLGDPDVAEHLVALLKRHDGPDHQAARKALQDLTGADYILVP